MLQKDEITQNVHGTISTLDRQSQQKTSKLNLPHLPQYFGEGVSFVQIRTVLNYGFDAELCKILGFAGLLF